ncbi:MAG: (2Fe-2S)-binding protein [Nitrospirales bacterium]|nr:MAG: (2Fe-2S)-binding protein [Nitrospirales bacterium]
MNGKPTKPVGRDTVESLIKSEIKPELLPQPYFFCNAPDCDTVYVSEGGDHLITKDMLTVRVGIKEAEDPIPLCYCFGYTRADIRKDIHMKNNTDIEAIIRQRVKAKECWCEKANPSGACCLGEVAKAINHAKTLRDQGLL